MAMSKKDYVAIAKVINEQVDLALNFPPAKAAPIIAGLRNTAENIATYCGGANPNFQRGRFLEACGVV